MYIHEAAKIAEDTNRYMARSRAVWEKYLRVKPTNTPDCCILLNVRDERSCPRWQPKYEDLIANDWLVVD